MSSEAQDPCKMFTMTDLVCNNSAGEGQRDLADQSL